MSKGVYVHKKTGKYAAQINRDGVRYFLGLHSTEKAAADARAVFEMTLPQINPPASPAPEGAITQTRVRELFHYQEETGQLVWKARTSRRVSVGDLVSHITVNGYLSARVDGKAHLAHRLIWLYVHGQFPKREIDHKDGNRMNNRMDNLREANREQNMQNSALRSDNALGHSGVYFNPIGNKFVAHVQARGVLCFRQSFETLDDAIIARRNAKAKFHEFQPVQRGM